MNIPEIHPEKVNLADYTLIDVRSKEEYHGELGHIKNSELITLGDDLEQYLESADKNQGIIFICRSGNRSGKATLFAKEKGFADVLNLTGGMILWNELNLEVEK